MANQAIISTRSIDFPYVPSSLSVSLFPYKKGERGNGLGSPYPMWLMPNVGDDETMCEVIPGLVALKFIASGCNFAVRVTTDGGFSTKDGTIATSSKDYRDHEDTLIVVSPEGRGQIINSFKTGKREEHLFEITSGSMSIASIVDGQIPAQNFRILVWKLEMPTKTSTVNYRGGSENTRNIDLGVGASTHTEQKSYTNVDVKNAEFVGELLVHFGSREQLDGLRSSGFRPEIDTPAAIKQGVFGGGFNFNQDASKASAMKQTQVAPQGNKELKTALTAIFGVSLAFKKIDDDHKKLHSGENTDILAHLMSELDGVSFEEEKSDIVEKKIGAVIKNKAGILSCIKLIVAECKVQEIDAELPAVSIAADDSEIAQALVSWIEGNFKTTINQLLKAVSEKRVSGSEFDSALDLIYKNSNPLTALEDFMQFYHTATGKVSREMYLENLLNALKGKKVGKRRVFADNSASVLIVETALRYAHTAKRADSIINQALYQEIKKGLLS